MTGSDQTVLSVIVPTAGTYQVAASLNASVGLLAAVSCHIVGGSASPITVSPLAAVPRAPIPVTDAVTVAAGDTISVACLRTGLATSSIQNGEINAIRVSTPT